MFLTLGLLILLALGCASHSPKSFSVGPIGKQQDSRLQTGQKAAATPIASTAIQTVAFTEPTPRLPDPTAASLIREVGKPALEAISTAESRSLTLPELERIALSHNPTIRQAGAASARAAGIRTQVSLKPNPTLGYFGEEIGNGGVAGLHGGYISQPIIRGQKLHWNRRLIDHDVRTMNWQIEVQRQRVLTDLRVVFYAALAAQTRLELAREFKSVVEQGVAVSEQRVDAKVGTRPDVLQSEIQLYEVELTIRQAELELKAALTEMSAIAGVDDLGAFTFSGELISSPQSRDFEAEFAQITASSPLLAAAQTRVDRARTNIRRQHVQAIPNVTAQLGAGADDGTGNAFSNVQLSLPIPVHNQNQGNIRAAQAEYCAAIQNVERIRMSIRRDLAQTMQAFSVAEATVRQYVEMILPKAEETLNLIQEAQAAGEFDFLRVLTARRAYFDAQLKYVAALGELAQAGARVDGLLLTGGLSNVPDYTTDDSLRGQALSGR